MNWVRAFRDNVSLPFEWHVNGFNVIDDQENIISKVIDLLCEEETGTVRYLIAELGGLMGISGRKVLLPVEILTRAGSGQVIVSTAREKIQDSPVINDVENPSRDEESAIQYHYGLRPYWLLMGGGPTKKGGKKPEEAPPRGKGGKTDDDRKKT